MSDFIPKILTDLFGIVVMFGLALVATYWVWLPRFLRSLARHNFIITAVKEGTAKAFLTYGQFHRFTLSWRGHYFDEEWNVVDELEDKKPLPQKNSMTDHWIDRLLTGGLRWLGFKDTIDRTHFQWTSIRQGSLGAAVQTSRGTEAIVEQGQLKDLLISRDEEPDCIYLKEDVYGITFQDTEDQDMIPLSFIAQLTASIKNPYKALFKTEQWLEQVSNFLRSHIKDYVGQRTFSQLTGTVDEGAPRAQNQSKIQSDEILKNYKAPDGTPLGEYILEKWGVKIESINLVNFRTSGKRGEAYEASAAEQYQQKQKAKGIVAIAEAESKRLVLIAKGQAQSIEMETAAIKAGGPDALTVRTLQAYEEIGRNGNMVVIGGDKPPQMLINSTRPDQGGKK
jgi:regulator of protease activity HflC (stomatin/prohibitin superfamily)